MKKIYILALAALALLAASCAKETFTENGTTATTITKTFTVTAPEGTRTELSGINVLWSEGDQINVIAKTSGNQYAFTLSEGAGTASAKFSGTIAEADAGETQFYALYPNVAIRSEETNNKGERWALDLDQLVIDQAVTAQEAVEGGFPTTAAFMTAVSDADGKLAFRHGAAYFKIQISAEGVKSIHFEVSGGARLGGRPIYNMSDGSTFQVNGAKNFMDFTCEGGFKKDATYYLPVLTKQSDCGTLTLTFNGDNAKTATAETTSLNKVKLASGKIYDLGAPAIKFTPIIVADDVAVDADATSGSIAYEITNATADGVLRATLQDAADWITIGEIAEDAVYFTLSANTGAVRSATVVLSYFYGAESVTKEIVITQAAQGSTEVSRTHLFYIDSEGTVKNLTDGVDGDYYTVTGTSLLTCAADGYFGVNAFEILGNTYTTAKKIDGSNSISFTTNATASSTIRFFAARRQTDKDGIIKLKKGSSNIINASMTYKELYDSGVVNLDKNTEYKFDKSGEVGIFYIEVTETFE